MTNRPRESDPTARPSDAVTGKVVARWMNWSRGCVPVKPGLAREKIVAFMEGTGDPNDECLGSVGDPRSDTDAALELLGNLSGSLPTSTRHPYGWDHAVISSKRIELYRSWPDDGPDLMHTLPISGEPFRYAVVHLAARVWGIE